MEAISAHYRMDLTAVSAAEIHQRREGTSVGFLNDAALRPHEIAERPREKKLGKIV